MPRSETVLGVFVASPSDVSGEREALESVVLELNKLWSKNLNLRLDLIKWETDTYPGFGTYPQNVINEQVNDDYDVFIAIFWGKTGSSTPVAESGTIEEFDRAYKKFTNNKDSIDIMVYFKDQAIPPSKMDYEQLQKIQTLKKKLGEKGGYYWTFDTIDDFESLLRSHLSQVAQKWSLKSNNKALASPEPIELIKADPDITSLNEDDDYGLLDYIEMYDSRMFDMNTSIKLMGEATEKIGDQVSLRAKELGTLQETEGNTDPKKTRKIIKLTSDDMNRYSDILESLMQTLPKSRKEAFDALSKRIAISVDFKEEADENTHADLKINLENMNDSAKGAYSALSGFKETIADLPRLTAQLNRAKRRTVKALDNVLEEIKAILQSSTNVLKIIDELEE